MTGVYAIREIFWRFILIFNHLIFNNLPVVVGDVAGEGVVVFPPGVVARNYIKQIEGKLALTIK